MMRRSVTAIIYFITGFSAVAQLDPLLFQFRRDSIVEWEYYFNDEFAGSDVKEEHWYKGYPWGGLYMTEDSYADPQNLSVREGILNMQANKADGPRSFPAWMLDTVQLKKYGKKLVDGKYPLKYTTGAIWSKEQFRYGYFECRFKSVSGSGLWPAFWLYGGNPNDEIDFMELKGEKDNKVHVDVHCPTNCDGGYRGFLGIRKNWGGWIKVSNGLYNNWNIISGIWKPGEVIFFLNGNILASFKGDFKNSMNLIASLSVAVDNGAFKPGPDKNTKFPSVMEIDYIRVWKSANDTNLAAGRKKRVQPDNTEKTQDVNLKPALKKKIPYMLRKKDALSEEGFVSLFPKESKKYIVNINGRKIKNISITITDKNGKVIKKDTFTSVFSELDLTSLQTGEYTLTISSGKKSSTVSINLE